MKKKKIMIITMVLLVFLTTGCTKSFQDKETERAYTKNILCRPTDEDTIEIYERNKVDVSKLPKCEKIKVTSGGYEGLWTNIFVKPLAWLIVKVGNLIGNYGLSIIVLGILLRLIVLPLSKQTINMSENLKKAQPELDRIEKKYANMQDQEALLRKNQEMLMVYKKYDIKPFSGCLVSLIQLPLFFAFLEAVQRLPIILEGKLLWFELGTTSWIEISNGNYYYIVINIAIALVTYFSFNNMNTANMNEESQAQTKFMSKMMTVFITIMSFSLNIAIGLYWFSTSAFAIIQNYILKKEILKKK